MKTKNLNINNPNHITCKYENLLFEVVGGINTETLQSLRVMLIVRFERITLRENIDLYNGHNLTTFQRKVADQTKLAIKYVEEAFNVFITELETYKLDLMENEKPSNVVAFELTENEKNEAIAFLKEQNLLKRTNELIATSGIIGSEKERLNLFLIYLSRKQEMPLHAIIQSNDNYLQTKVGQLIPDEDKIEISHLSDNALFYFDEDQLSNKVILIEDTDKANRRRLLPLFDLQRKGHFSKTTIQKDATGELRTVQRFVRGTGVVLSISTKDETVFSDYGLHHNFSFTETVSKSNEELMMQYQRRQSAGLVNRFDEEQAIKTIQNVQRVLQPLKVINRFAEQLILPEQMLNKQVTNAHYLKFIEVVTFFNQFQREQKTDEVTGEVYLETTIEDIEQANDLLKELLLKKCDTLNKQTRAYFEKLKSFLKQNDKTSFTNYDMFLGLSTPMGTVKRYHTILSSNGFLKVTTGKNKAEGYSYEVINENEVEAAKSSIDSILDQVISKIKSDSKSKINQVVQIENEPLKELKTIDLSTDSNSFNKGQVVKQVKVKKQEQIGEQGFINLSKKAV